MPRVIHFAIHADNPPRAMKFYADLFGWTFQKFLPNVEYWDIATARRISPESTAGS